MAHLIPGFYILDKAKQGIDGHHHGVKLFPLTMIIGYAISYFISVFALIRETEHNRKVTKRRLEEEKLINEEFIVNVVADQTNNMPNRIYGSWIGEGSHRTDDTAPTTPAGSDENISEGFED